jgi:hypothetical protein
MTPTDPVPADPSSPIPAALTHLTDTEPLQFQDADAPHLLAYLAAVPEPGAARGRRHPPVAILRMAAAAVLAGARSLAATAERVAEAPQVVPGWAGRMCATAPGCGASAWKSWRLRHCTYLVILVPSRLRWMLAARVA